MDVKGISNCVINWPTCYCGVTAVRISRRSGLSHNSLALTPSLAASDQLVAEFGNRFYTLDSVTKVTEEKTFRVVAAFGIKPGIQTQLWPWAPSSLLRTHVLLSNIGRQLFQAGKYETVPESKLWLTNSAFFSSSKGFALNNIIRPIHFKHLQIQFCITAEITKIIEWHHRKC